MARGGQTDNTQHADAQTQGIPAVRDRNAKGDLQSAAESSSAVHEARREIGAAFQDATDIFRTGKATAGSVLPRMVQFLQGRLSTVRQALQQFMEGYSEGLQEVCPRGTSATKSAPVLGWESALLSACVPQP